MTPTPFLKELCVGFKFPEWFLERVQRLSTSEDVFERIVSVGLIARYAAALSCRPGEVLQDLIAGRESPGYRASTWARAMTGSELDDVERLLLEAADILRSDLLELGEIAVVDADTVKRTVLVVCLRRDELESVSWVLRAAGRQDVVNYMLGAIDEEASRHVSMLDLAVDDDLISTIAWQSPEAWWGAPGRL